jgi:hypothetical protein
VAQFHVDKFEQLTKSRQFLKSIHCQDEIHNLNRHRTIDKIEFIITKLPKRKSPGADDFTGEI